MKLHATRKHHHLGETIDLDLTEAGSEKGADKAQGLLRNFVRRGGVPKWGTALNTFDTVKKLKAVDSFAPNEIGCHSVVLVYFEQVKPGGPWRFIQVSTEDVQVTH